MVEPEYTPGPWIRGWEHETQCAVTAVVNGEAYDVATVRLNGGIRLGPPGANGNPDRIIACVNLLEGVPTATLLADDPKAAVIFQWVRQHPRLAHVAEMAFLDSCLYKEPTNGSKVTEGDLISDRPAAEPTITETQSGIILVESADNGSVRQPEHQSSERQVLLHEVL